MPDPPRATWRGTLAAWGFSALICAFVVSQVSPLVNQVTFDESNLVYDAHRLSLGEVVYQGFFSFLPPGTHYVLWAAQGLVSGRPETAARYAAVACVLAAWGFLYLALRRSGGSRALAAAAAALFPVCLFPFSPFGFHYWFGTCSLFAALALASSLWKGSGRTWQWILLGGLSALCAWLDQASGAAAAVVLLISALGSGRGFSGAARTLAWTLAGGIAASLALWSPVLWHRSVLAAWQDVVMWPMRHYRQPGNINDMRVLGDMSWRMETLWDGAGAGPWGFLTRISGTALYGAVLLLAASACGAALLFFVRVVRSRKVERLEWAVFTGCAAVSAGLFLQNPTWVHLIYAMAPVVFLGAVTLLREREGRVQKEWRWILPLAVLLLLGFVYHGRALVGRAPQPWEWSDVDRLDRESPLNESLRASTLLKPGDTIVVLPTGGNIYLYTRPAAIGFTYLFPLEDGYHGLQDHARAAAEIEDKKPKLILVHQVRFKAFLEGGGPLALVIRRDYSPGPGSPAVALFVRNGT